MVMNFSFLFSGTVSTNAQMILLAIYIVVAGANAGKFGLDRFASPYMKSVIANKTNKRKKVQQLLNN
jgi:thiosulfate dehydrogenase [quinone] large subunit